MTSACTLCDAELLLRVEACFVTAAWLTDLVQTLKSAWNLDPLVRKLEALNAAPVNVTCLQSRTSCSTPMVLVKASAQAR